MICNSDLTIYHKGVDENTKIETYDRYYYKNVWFFGGHGVSTNKGLQNANDVKIRIPYNANDINISNIDVGDILVKGRVDLDIEEQADLAGCDVYIITSVNDNSFGSSPHVHIEGK